MMHNDYGFMLTGLLCFASMGIIHKLGDRKHAHPLGLTLTAMATASLMSFFYAT
jgi:hypothetical protein